MTFSILKCEEEIMWALLLGAIFVAFLLLKRRETFVVKYGNPFDGEDLLSFDMDAKGTRLFSTTPDTCPLNKPVLDAGLCYEECEDGYHGVGPVCWANSESVGIGTIPSLEWYKKEVDFFFFKVDMWLPRQVCYDDRENKDGLCYRKCPKQLPDRIPGMPYLCAKLSRGLSYGRGVGVVPPLFHFGA